jgi:subtilase family serine protease
MRKLLCGSALVLVASLLHGGAAATSSRLVIANNTPRFVAGAQKVSDVASSTMIDVTLWLKPHNLSAVDSLIQREYDRNSPLYHHFISREAMGRLVGPTDEEFRTVLKFAEAHKLTAVAKDKYNLFVRVRGTAAAVQDAFSVKLAYVSFKGRTYRVNLNDPAMDEVAGSHIMAIGGLDDVKFEHHNIAQLSAVPGGKAADAVKTQRDSVGFSNVCFNGTTTETFTSGGADPTGTFTGNFYAKTPAGCGYTPTDIQTAYGLTALYGNGYNGAGQTIVIVDWCGEETIVNDANAFSKKFGLPPLTSSNFSIINYPGQSYCASPDPEINIDVEWSHAIAPGANIILVVPPSPTFSDIDAALLYIAQNQIGNITSNSYGAPEIAVSPNELSLQNFILGYGAAEGISNNFSSGDSGDGTGGFPGNPASVSAPANSPNAVAVGGITLSLNSADTILWQGGWGTNETLIAEPGFVPDPSITFGFGFGSGGGTSVADLKPKWQSALRGKYRKVPDISWLGDPFTGGVIAITQVGSPGPAYTVYGGTSLACPMFAGLWAIANQAAGTNLGLASPLLYGAPSNTITDIVPVGSTTNVTGILTNGSSTTRENAPSLAQPLEKTKLYVTGIWNYPFTQDLAYVISFGTDTGLYTTPGWDDVTGLGVAAPGALVSYLQAHP